METRKIFSLFLELNWSAHYKLHTTVLFRLPDKKIESKIQNLEDLVKSKIKYGVLKDGQLFTFLRDSKSPTHRKMFSHITEVETTVNGSKAGVARARRGGYAYLTEIPILEYWSSRRPCNTMLVKNLLEVKSYGFGLPKNSENTNVLSVNILKVRELLHFTWKNFAIPIGWEQCD